MKHLTLLTLSLIVLTGCIESPLLKHADADSVLRQNQTDSDCEISLPSAGLCASLTWEQVQTRKTMGSFFLRFWDPKLATKDGPYVSPSETVEAELKMPAMGHGSSPITTTPLLDANGVPVPGVYHSTNVYFSMPGHWEIWVQLWKGPDEPSEQAKIDIQH